MENVKKLVRAASNSKEMKNDMEQNDVKSPENCSGQYI